MSLLDFLRPQGAQAPGSMQQPSGLARLLAPEVALPMAAALMGQNGNMQNLGNAFAAGGQGMAQQKESQAQKANETKTYDFFKRQAPEYAEMIEAGMPVNQAWKQYTEQRYAQQSGNEVFGTPIYGTDENGKEGLGVIRKDGTFGLLDTGSFNVSRGAQMMDTGTGYTPVSKSTGQPMGPVLPIDNAGAAADKAAGTAIGQDKALYDSVTSKMPGLEMVVQKLDGLSEKATYTAGGQGLDWAMKQSGMEPREAAVARAEYIAMVDNQVLPMLRDTFGAAFTVKEGETLRATLGDPDKSPKEKQAVLRAFIEQKRRDVEALGVRTGQGAPQQAGPRLRFNPATGELE